LKKILILTWTPFYKWDYKRYGLDELDKIFEIIVFDISRILFDTINITKIYKKYDRIKTHKFYKKKALIKSLKNKNFDLVINLAGLNSSNDIYKEILKKKIKIITIIDHKLGSHIFFPRKIFIILRYIYKKIQSYFYKKIKYEFFFIGAENIYNKIRSVGVAKIYSHSINYDLSLRNSKKHKKNKKKIVAYIDSGYGLHPDFKLINNFNKKFDLKNYSKKINFLFYTLKKMNYEIYFLSHPKIENHKQKIYKNCKIIYYKSHDYIKNSDLVIFSGSSVLDYAIMYKKKILRIFSNEVKSYPLCNKADNDFYKFFKYSSLNLDNLDDESQILDKIMPPNEKYKKYENMFIKHPKSKNVQYSKLIQRIINFK
jgi:hypothetical protein